MSRVAFQCQLGEVVGRRLVMGLAVCLLSVAGCWSSTTPPVVQRAEGGPDAESHASRILRRMVHRYQSADSYTDQAVVRRRYQQGEQVYEEEPFPWSVSLSRPAKLRLEVGAVTLADDGRYLRAAVAPGWAVGYEGQFVLRPAPLEITREALASDQQLAQLISASAGGPPVQLELLLGEDPLAELFAAPDKLTALADETIDDRPCFRVQAARPGGRYVFWIDRESYLLRRLEFPIDQPPPVGVEFDSVGCVADFPQATVGRSVPPSTFELNPPRGAVLVKQLVQAPEPVSTPLLGHRVDDFTLTRLDGTKVTRESLAGRVAVLVWFDNQPYSHAVLQQVSHLLPKYQSEAQVALLAVSPLPANLPNEDLARQFRQWKLDLPIARDLASAGRDVFLVRAAPTVIVLGRDGRVQACGVGADSELLGRLPEVIEQLTRNVDVAAQTLEQTERAYAEFEQQLTKANAAGATSIVPLPQTGVARRSEPKHLRPEVRWTCEELKQPGNLLVVESPAGAPTVFVCDGFQTVVELDGAGKVIARHPLDIPAEQAVTYLRTAVDGQGKRYFVGCSTLGRQAFLFDADWNRLLAYPSLDQPHEGIGDVALADLRGAGNLELVIGFWGVVGVHGVNLEGRRIWFNRQVAPALSVSVTRPDELRRRQVIVTSDSGDIARLSHEGELLGKFVVAGRSILQLQADFAPGESEVPYAALSVDSQGRLTVVGLSEQLREVWEQPLGEGVFQNQIRPLTAGPLLGANRNWVAAAPDGALYIMGSPEGLVDRFSVGEQLTGLVVLPSEGGAQLIISTRQGVTSWSFTLPRAASRDQ